MKLQIQKFIKEFEMYESQAFKIKEKKTPLLQLKNSSSTFTIRYIYRYKRSFVRT